jgi:hypothetical protein
LLDDLVIVARSTLVTLPTLNCIENNLARRVTCVDACWISQSALAQEVHFSICGRTSGPDSEDPIAGAKEER